jgi:hypothetical protein
MYKRSFITGMITLCLIFLTSAALQPDRQSKPWNGKKQVIPGKIIAAFFDEGGEGIAFHNPAAKNNGSEGIGLARNGRYEVGISTTKPGLDKYKDGTPVPYDKYYIGWTVPGEWLNYSVDVQNAGTYLINMLASSARNDAAISLLVNGEDVVGEIVLETTGHVHTWQLYANLAEIKLEKGPQILTLKFLKQGLMNVQYLEFVQK